MLYGKGRKGKGKKGNDKKGKTKDDKNGKGKPTDHGEVRRRVRLLRQVGPQARRLQEENLRR